MSSEGMTRRQGVRRILLVLSFIAFPATMNYFSPYLVVEASFRGIANGSLLVFAAMFVLSLAVGRLWCGWLCPAAGLQEPLAGVNSRRPGRRADLVKWFIWVPWVVLIVFGAARAGGWQAVEPLYGTVGGISVAGDAHRPVWAAYLVYFVVVLVFLGVTLALGRRGGCHAICWMAPLMIAGRRLRNAAAWPSLRLAATPPACRRCGACTEGCPMGLQVREMVARGSMEHPECVLCGTCADTCPAGAIRFAFGSGR
jgi:polyferredoxin